MIFFLRAHQIQEEEYAPELKSSVGVYNNYMRQRKCHAFLGLCLEAIYIEQPEQPVSFIIRFLRQKYVSRKCPF